MFCICVELMHVLQGRGFEGGFALDINCAMLRRGPCVRSGSQRIGFLTKHDKTIVQQIGRKCNANY